MYEAFVTQEPNRQADGMVHFTVEFRDSAGVLPVVPQKSFTSTFTEDWFKRWCKRQVEMLNAPQEIAGVTVGAVDLTGVVVPEPVVRVEPTRSEKDFSTDSLRYLRLKAIVDAGITLPKVLADELAALKTGLVAALADKPNLSKRFPGKLL